MLQISKRPCIGLAQHRIGQPTAKRGALFLVWRAMATKRNELDNEKKRKPESHDNRDPFDDSKLKRRTDKVSAELEQEQARLWRKVQRVTANLSTGSVAQRTRALERLYADLVATSALSSFTSSDRGRQLFGDRTSREILQWAEEQRRLEMAVFYAKVRSAGLWIFATLGDVGVFTRLGKLLSFIAWTPMFLLARIITAPLPIMRYLVKREESQ